MWVVVPVKQFHLAKQRLSSVLSDDERMYLAKMLLHDVLQSITNSPLVTQTVIVSRDPVAEEIALAFGCSFLAEQQSDLSLAVSQGAEYAKSQGASAFAMVPGDVPLVTAAEITTLIARPPRLSGITIVADRHGTGTNGVVVRPVNLMPFQFGEGSFQRHTQAANELGVTVEVLSLPGMSLDIDTPQDLGTLLNLAGDTASAGYLRSIEVWNRLRDYSASSAKAL
ncbi:MAG: 2-phospho-L-lactate guanylyltransferase [Gammaproteobacteria bacterium]